MWSWYYDHGECTADTFLGWGGGGAKRNTVSDISTPVSRKVIKTSSWPQHYMILHVSIRFRYFSTNEAKNKNKFKVFPAPRNAPQILFFLWIPADKFTTPAPDVINPDCVQWIILDIFLQIASSQQVDIDFQVKIHCCYFPIFHFVPGLDEGEAASQYAFRTREREGGHFLIWHMCHTSIDVKFIFDSA